MRIISGIYGGRPLQTPKDKSIRPTSDKIRGSIFNALGSRVDLADMLVLDLFCGTGALGLEALSRGAGRVLFADQSSISLDLAKANAKSFEALGACDFMLGDACRLVNKEGVRADVFFCDPPYKMDLISPALANLFEQNWLVDGAIGVLESEKHWSFIPAHGFTLLKEKVYGDTKVTLVEFHP